MKILNLVLQKTIYKESKVYLNNLIFKFPGKNSFKFSSSYSSNLNSSSNLKKNFLISSKYSNQILSFKESKKSLLFRRYTTQINESKNPKNEQSTKKMSKFKEFYSQYGPTFLIVHLITVVMWIYGFFLISKQLKIFYYDFFFLT